MTLLLTRLDIHGFKSFATQTSFLFDRGITAIVGPNGSGKSNVAEALRWVLGEQGYANLRSRKTEDVIFSGSDRRAALGMAEVIVTFDNRDGDLPLAFDEVTVSRRAYRSGENQYLINGARVRLKDVQRLVAPLGQAYTIIGQGLVDAALSQRPEERRGLFEHAAGIGGLRLQATEAERGLHESAANAARLHDILGELEPRVRSLERSARLAREYGAVRESLRRLQQRYYARLWRESQERINAARLELKQADALLAAAEEHQTLASSSLGIARGDERRLAEAARRCSADIADAERNLAEEQHRRDMLEARIRAAEERLGDQRAARVEAERQHQEAMAEAERLTHDIASIEERLEAAEAQLSAIEAASAATRARHAELDDALQRVERETLDRTRARAAAAGAQAAYTDRLRALEQERAAVGDQRSRDMQVRDETQAALDALETRRAQLHAQIGALEATVAGQSAEEAELRARFSEQEQALAAAERELAALQTRLEALERTHLAGEGLYAGVRAVLRAVRQGRLTLPGLLGPLGELIAVPPDLETAIEVALGGHLQDIVVASWADADAAIAFLKRDGAGRATFQPLETVRMPRSQRLDLQDPGIVGIAADLIGHDPRIAAVVANTLGRVLVVDDLDATRRVLGSAPGWTIVTRTGEITRPGGSVTGGSRVAEAGMLARERERRGLPGRIAARKAALAETSAARDDVARQRAARAEELAGAKAQLERVRQEERGVAGEQARLERDLATVLTALARHDARARDIGQRLAALHDEQAEQQSHLAALDTRLAELAEEREQIRQALAALPPVDPAGSATLRAEIAGLRERSSSAAQALARARARGASAERAQAARAAEMAHIDATLAAARRELGDVLDAIALQADAIERARAGLLPLEQERADVAKRVAAGERALDDATARVRDAERERDRASLGLARAQDEQVFLAERIRNDLDLDDPDALHDDASGDAAATDPAATEAEVQRLRERLRRMAVVGDDVLEQYESEAARLAHLSDQLRDVEEAAAGLRSVLAQLHGKMAERFDATFREVGAAFERTFVRLFGGGTARLALHTGDDGTTSIDIIAQPPGKRISGLAALSGGERALTAVALLLAIQRVNPSPFCLLDEVDAALDESNVLRFRDELRDLSGSTQFIVITHNRGTIEGADTLYGVTMGEDSVSRVISLRLEDAVRQVEEREMAEAAGG